MTASPKAPRVQKGWAIAHPSDGALVLGHNGFPQLWEKKCHLLGERQLVGGFKAVRVKVTHERI